jgi:DNA repair exonuclease SbcCD nuclease subunit
MPLGMARFTFLHAADLHLDAPFSGVGRVPADVAAVLRDASIDAWSALIDLAVARDVAAVLLAGGLCDGLERGARAQARLRDGLQRLVAHGIAVYVALGGRDPADGIGGLRGWPHGVAVFDQELQSVPLERNGVRLATVHGIGARGCDAASLVHRVMVDPACGPHLGLMHALVGGREVDEAACGTCAESALRESGVDYWALGHTHELTYLSRGDPWIVYPGTLQGRGLVPAESAAKGAVVVEVDGGVIEQVTFEPLDRVRCLRIELADAAELDGVRRALDASAAALRAAHVDRALVLDAIIDGTPRVLRALRRPDACAALLRELRRTSAHSEPFVWWSAVRPRVSPAEIGATGDLTAEVGRVRAELAADPAQCAQFLARRFEPLRYAWAADVEPREAEELLDTATALAIDVLSDAEDGA